MSYTANAKRGEPIPHWTERPVVIEPKLHKTVTVDNFGQLRLKSDVNNGLRHVPITLPRIKWLERPDVG